MKKLGQIGTVLFLFFHGQIRSQDSDFSNNFTFSDKDKTSQNSPKEMLPKWNIVLRSLPEL